jgi:tetratricopeptide (TPR) repeat protein
MKTTYLKYLIAILLIISTSIQLFSQNKIEDENETELQNIIDGLNDIAWDLIYIYPDSSLKLASKALEYSKQINYHEGFRRSYNTIAEFHSHGSNLNKSLYYFKKALSHAYQENNLSSIAKVMNNVGSIYNSLAVHDKALTYLHNSYRIGNMLRDSLIMIYTLYNIAKIYMDLKDYDTALKYLKLTMNFKSLDDNTIMLHCYNVMGILYRKKHKFDQAELFFKKSYEFSQKQNNKLGISTYYNNMGEIYMSKGLYEKAESSMQKALQIRKDAKLIMAMGISYSSIANLYLEIAGETDDVDLFKKSEKFALKALEISKQINAAYHIKANYELLIDISKNLNDFEKTLFYMNQFDNINDSLLNIEKKIEIEKLENHFTALKEQSKIEQLKAVNSFNQKTIQKNKRILLSLLLFVVLFTVSFLLYIHQKRKHVRSGLILMKELKEESSNEEFQLDQIDKETQLLGKYSEFSKEQIRNYTDKLTELFEIDKIHYDNNLSIEKISKFNEY